ncbi:MAG TPA: redox-sensing transcriptional repressor Rex [Anaerolinea thermolimosa]|uniref:Redox-sensing transcriptional repressor Rex n=1 Tax=Anaerolinea thermolimosa TaxID=229919 RepID=A0A3D1JJX1_9CHLR|nr:redox-sensing transcriptional repressor Rex [Anaerolinea thermolimosa]GAP06251.1 AT-rich DNA-binding protein [Anaerolinea thermolimosa]HCE18547.1 redox-sensing transcriptional repressor Rex [Anaerolinea thermolimosa]
MPEKSIPDVVVSRLPRYLQALEHLEKDGVQTTSSQELGEFIGISAAQIRKDLSQYGEFGKQGKGYNIHYLIHKLREILKVNRIWEMALVGAGNLGHAIANYQGFAEHGFRIALIFDSDPLKIGQKAGNLIVQDANQMVEKIRHHGIKIGMITVPASEAQAVADSLIAAGVRAILNYAPITLSVPRGVHVQYVDPIIYLQRMTYYLE